MKQFFARKLPLILILACLLALFPALLVGAIAGGIVCGLRWSTLVMVYDDESIIRFIGLLFGIFVVLPLLVLAVLVVAQFNPSNTTLIWSIIGFVAAFQIWKAGQSHFDKPKFFSKLNSIPDWTGVVCANENCNMPIECLPGKAIDCKNCKTKQYFFLIREH